MFNIGTLELKALYLPAYFPEKPPFGKEDKFVYAMLHGTGHNGAAPALKQGIIRPADFEPKKNLSQSQLPKIVFMERDMKC